MSGDGRQDAGRGRLIWNDLWGEFTAQSPARMARDDSAGECPFCADVARGMAPEGARAWIRPNDFPALTPPDGECLLIIYSRDHERRYSDLTQDEALEIVGLWQNVYERLSPTYPVVMTWETSGAEIGQTQQHPHGQTYGIAVTPELLRREMQAVNDAKDRGAPCPFCRAVAQDSRGPLAVYDGNGWFGFVPRWARYPYQIQLVSQRHVSAVPEFERGGVEARELASILPRIIRAWDRLYEDAMPYMLALHQLADPAFHLHIELLPVGRAPGKLKMPASSEMAWGFWLNDSAPEKSAAQMRAALDDTP